MARVQCKPNAAQLASIANLVEAGKLQPHVATVLPFAGIKQDLAPSEGGRTRGKIVIDLNQ